jgi:hypothetical protein
VVLAFIATEGLRYNLNKKEIDLSNYHLNVKDPAKYLIKEKYIVTYNKAEHSLNRIGHISTTLGKVLAQPDKLIIPKIKMVNEPEWLEYNQRLEKLGCSSENLASCIQKRFVQPISYIENGGEKSYLVEKLFALKLYEVVLKYDNYLKNKKN